MGRRASWIAFASTLVFFGLLGWVIVNAPNWPDVQASFLDADVFADALPDLAWALRINVQLFLIAEALVLVLGLVIAVLRSLPGPVFFPIRLLAIAYADIFRALPGVLVIFVLGLGIPGLRIPGVPSEPFFWAVVAVTLVYSAYVSEVYRAGIESIHPSQEAAARSLGLTRAQSMRYVILPQAVRRVVPPLLNDFIGLQKDTVLVSFIGVAEVFRTAQIKESANFNFTPYLAVALLFLVITLPLTRITDWLIARDRAGRSAGART
jgi:polar amino acid transport system permease protein